MTRVALLLPLLIACQPRPLHPGEAGWRPPTTGVDYGSYPTGYEDLAKGWFSVHLKDPESVRYRRISKPRREHAITDQFKYQAVYGYSFCVEYNAKNSYGGYGGFETQWFLVRNGELVRTHSADEVIYLGHDPDCRDGDEPSAAGQENTTAAPSETVG